MRGGSDVSTQSSKNSLNNKSSPNSKSNSNKLTLVDEIIDNASALPLEYQDCILEIAKGMAFTRKHLSKQQEETSEQRTA